MYNIPISSHYSIFRYHHVPRIPTYLKINLKVSNLQWYILLIGYHHVPHLYKHTSMSTSWTDLDKKNEWETPPSHTRPLTSPIDSYKYTLAHRVWRWPGLALGILFIPRGFMSRRYRWDHWGAKSMLIGSWYTYQSSEEEWVGFKSPFRNSSARCGSIERMTLST
jgi:hypothetical protein